MCKPFILRLYLLSLTRVLHLGPSLSQLVTTRLAAGISGQLNSISADGSHCVICVNCPLITHRTVVICRTPVMTPNLSVSRCHGDRRSCSSSDSIAVVVRLRMRDVCEQAMCRLLFTNSNKKTAVKSRVRAIVRAVVIPTFISIFLLTTRQSCPGRNLVKANSIQGCICGGGANHRVKWLTV